MKAFVANAQWAPQSEYPLTSLEQKNKRAVCGNKVWKNPFFTMTDIPIPDVGDHEVLVQTKSCGICGSDSHLYETDKDDYIIFSGPVRLPCIIGHEYAGIIKKTGRKVRNFSTGDPVTGESIIWCGQCTSCRSGAPNQCSRAELAGITVNGALAEYMVVHERQLWKIEKIASVADDTSLFDLGALIEPIGCAYNGLFISGGGFLPGSIVVVYGAGPIGLGAVSLAYLAGASKIFVFDRIAKRLEIAAKLGATKTWNIDELKAANISPAQIVLENTGGHGADIQVEAAGAAHRTIPEMEASLATNGTIVYLGRTGKAASLTLDGMVTGATGIIGARGHAGYGIFPNIIQLISSGRLDLKEMITSCLPFSETLQALKQSVTKQDGKILIHM